MNVPPINLMFLMEIVMYSQENANVELNSGEMTAQNLLELMMSNVLITALVMELVICFKVYVIVISIL